MAAEQDFTKLPRDLQQLVMELRLQQRIRDLQGRYWHEFGELSRKELDLIRGAYMSGLADGLEEALPQKWREVPAVSELGPERKGGARDPALNAVLAEYMAKDQALDRLIGLLGRVMQEHPEAPQYRSRLNDILYELDSKVSELRKGTADRNDPPMFDRS